MEINDILSVKLNGSVVQLKLVSTLADEKLACVTIDKPHLFHIVKMEDFIQVENSKTNSTLVEEGYTFQVDLDWFIWKEECESESESSSDKGENDGEEGDGEKGDGEKESDENENDHTKEKGSENNEDEGGNEGGNEGGDEGGDNLENQSLGMAENDVEKNASGRNDNNEGSVVAEIIKENDHPSETVTNKITIKRKKTRFQ